MLDYDKILGYPASQYQKDIMDFVAHGTGNAVVCARAGAGKCLGKDTDVLMYDGTIKKVQDIVEGDLLMGDDSTPRRVLTTNKGFGGLRKIIPSKGDPWICNDVHVLTMDQKNNNKRKSTYKRIDMPIDVLEKGDNIPVQKDENGYYCSYKLVRTGVDFPKKDVPIDPWSYGVWVASEDIDEIFVSNDSMEKLLSESMEYGEKIIMRDYLINDKETRRKVLFAIIDTIGYYKDNTVYIDVTRSERFANDIVFLSRSLGSPAYVTDNNSGVYTVSMPIITESIYYPTKTGRLKNVKKDDPCRVSFKIEDIGEGEYYGFTLDGNGRFLLGDFTITHNTTTLVALMKCVPSNKTCRFFAFNKEIARILGEKIKDNKNCESTTIHKLGLKACYRNLGPDIEIDEYKYRTYLKNNIDDLYMSGENLPNGNLPKSKMNEVINNISSLIDFSRVNHAQSEKEIERVANKYGISKEHDVVRITKKILDWGKTNTKTIDYTDMVWLPVELDMDMKPFQCDYIFGDEAQDFSIIYIELLKKCHKRGTRTVYVADDLQAINAFAGASEEAFNYLCKQKNTKLFSLPITYRCPIKVVEMAKEYAPDIQARPNAPMGEIVDNIRIEDMQDGDMVLSRSRAPLFNCYNKLLKRHKKCYISGAKEEFDDMEKMLNKTTAELLVPSLMSEGVFSQLYEQLFNLRNHIMKSNGLDMDDATLSGPVMKMYDAICSIQTIAEGSKTKTDLLRKINKIKNEKGEGIKLSTIHKAKGDEADNVYILCYSTMPSTLAKKEWEIKQEINLVYVAITRPKKRLGFVSETEIKPYATLLEKGIITKELSSIENLVCKINGKEPMKREEGVQMAKFKLKSASDLTEIQKMNNSLSLTRNGLKQPKKSSLLELVGKFPK